MQNVAQAPPSNWLRDSQDLYVHQTETGRPVTDAVVQEVCKLRPDMIGLSLRDCIEVSSRRRDKMSDHFDCEVFSCRIWDLGSRSHCGWTATLGFGPCLVTRSENLEI